MAESRVAESGIVNVAHQLGNSLGLAVLVSLAAIGAHSLHGAAMLALALLLMTRRRLSEVRLYG